MNTFYKWIGGIIILFLLGTNVWLVGKLRTSAAFVEKTQERPADNDLKELCLLVNVQEGIKNNGTAMENLSLKVGDKVTTLQEYANRHSPLFVIRISNLYCANCVDYVMNKVERFCKKEGGKWKDHILVMGSYDSNNALKILLQRLEVPLTFCNVPQDAIGLPAEHVLFPYCFVLEENLEVKHLFIPDKVVPILSEEYFKSIINHYYSDEL